MKQLQLFITLFLCLLSAEAWPYDALIDGIYYNLSGDEAEVTYDIYNWNYSGDLVIPESVTYEGKSYRVTSIGKGTFTTRYGLTSVTIPKSVKSIGESAFSGCTGLKSVNIPEGVTEISRNTFRGCTALKNITIPEGVKSIQDEVFYNCYGLTSVTIPSSVTSVGLNAFAGCTGLTKVIAPNIAKWCNIDFASKESNPLFSGHHLYSDENTRITNLVIPDGVTYLGHYTFVGCSDLTSVTIPKSITSIGFNVFKSCI